jgi:hypothetical protein
VQPNEVISKLIDLQELTDSHTAQYLKLQRVPGKRMQASVHQCKAARLRPMIQELIHEIANFKLVDVEANAGEPVR